MGLDDSLKNATSSKTLDVLGKTCPYPILETGTALRKMETGEILEVLVDYEPSVRTGLPNFCDKYECDYCSEETSSDGKVFWKFYIKKSDKL